MFIVDDILLSPVHGLLWIVRELHQAAQEELATESESITEQLRELYMRLELGEVTEAQFAAQEKVLLDRLEQIEQGAMNNE